MSEQNNTTYRTSRLVPRARPDELRWLDVSFTTEGLDILQAFRRKLVREGGRSVSLGRALDALLKSHATATEARREEASA